MSRTLSAPVTAEIAKTEGVRPRTLFELYLDGGTIYYTDHSSNYSFGGHTYESRAITHSDIKTYMENRVDNATIEIDNVDKALSAYFASEDFQGRKVKIKKIFLGLTASDDYILQFEGHMDAPKVNESRISIKCVNKFDRSDSESPWRLFGLRCNWDFCGTQCGFNSGTKQTGTADSGTTTTAVDAALPSHATDYWKGAKFLILAGTNRGRWRYIDAYDDTLKKFTFLSAFPAAVDATTEYVIECDKARGTCETLGNVSQFDGFDEVLMNAFMGYTGTWASLIPPRRGGWYEKSRAAGAAMKPSEDVIPIVYGRAAVEGRLIDEYRSYDNTNALWKSDRIYGLCGGEISDVEAVHVDAVALSTFTDYPGSTSQSFSFHGETKYYRRTALVQKELVWKAGYYASDISEAASWAEGNAVVKAVVKGKLIQKYLANGSADGSPAWSENPVWCRLDFLMNELPQPVPAADIDFASWKAAADDCDSLGYRVGFKIDKQEEDYKILEKFDAACRGYELNVGGSKGYYIEQAASSVHSFDDDAAGEDNIIKGSFDYEPAELRDIPNKVIVTYIDSEVRERAAMADGSVPKAATSIDYLNNNISFDSSGTVYMGDEAVTYTGNTDYGDGTGTLTGCSARSNDYPSRFPIYQGIQLFPELTAIWEDPASQAAVKKVIKKEVAGQSIPTFALAYKMAEFIGNKGLKCDLFAGLTGMMESMALTAGDVVTVDHGLPGWTGALFRITEAAEGMNEEVKYRLRYYDATVYEENAGTPPVPLTTTLANPRAVPPDVTNLQMAEVVNIRADGTAESLITISFDPPTGDDAIFWRHAEIWYSTDNWTTKHFHYVSQYGDDIPPIRATTGASLTYYVKAISVSTQDKRADESTAPTDSTAPGGDTSAPSTPTGFTATAILAGIDLKWTNPSNTNFAAIQIFRDTVDSFPGGSPYFTITGERGKKMAFRDRAVTYGTSYYYWLKAVSRSGNAGSQTSSVNASPSQTADTDIASLSVNKLTAGTISSKAITLAVSEGSGDSKIQGGKTDFTNSQAGFILGIDDSDGNKAKLYMGDSSKYLNWDGSTLTVGGDIIATGNIQNSAVSRIKIESYSVGDILTSSADTEETTSTTAYVKVKEIVIPRAGALRIKFALKSSANYAYGRIYRNGAAIGTERSQPNSYQTYSEDVSGWSPGDLCQLYIHSQLVTDTAYAKEFRIYSSNPISPVVTVD